MAPTSKQRSDIMRAIKSRDTNPERIVRRIAYAVAPGYRLHRSDLPGKPDIAYISRKRAIFVNGCFWHGHHCKRGARIPKTNTDYWLAKISRNRNRDIESKTKLKKSCWRSLTIWECEMKQESRVAKKLMRFLT